MCTVHTILDTKLCKQYLFQISGTIANTGHSVIFTADNETSFIYEGPQTPVNLTGGPLSYRYRFHEIHIHYGLHDQFGSEHSVQGYTFPAEVSYFNNTTHTHHILVIHLFVHDNGIQFSMGAERGMMMQRWRIC